MKTLITWDVGTKNLAYAVWDAMNHRILRWKLLSVAWSSMDELPKRVHEALEQERFDDLDVPRDDVTVVIERQPGRNKTMLRVEAYLTMFFCTKGFPRVTLCHAVNKLKDTGEENQGRSRKMYDQRKKASVQLVHDYLQAHPEGHSAEALKTFHKAKKKDDLADALLQGIQFHSSAPQAQAKPIQARKPTEKQEQSGAYTRAGLKYVLQSKIKNTLLEWTSQDPVKILQSWILADPKVRKSVTKHYGSNLIRCAEEMDLASSLRTPAAP